MKVEKSVARGKVRGFNSLADKDSNYSTLMTFLERHGQLLDRQEDLITKQEALLKVTKEEKAEEVVGKIHKFVIEKTYSDQVWEGKYYDKVRSHHSPHLRGRFGEEVIAAYFASRGIPYEKIGRGGDGILWKDTDKQEEVEVKMASVDFKNEYIMTAWSNQLRPNYSQITRYFMVVVHPEKVEIYEFKRSEFDLTKLSAGHSGSVAKDIKQIQLEKSYNQPSFYERYLGVSVSPVAVFGPKDITVSEDYN